MTKTASLLFVSAEADIQKARANKKIVWLWKIAIFQPDSPTVLTLE